MYPGVERPAMLAGLEWLTLEVKYLDRAQAFYEAFLDLDVREESDSEATLGAGETDLVLRTPGDVPRGGLHTHYACSIPAAEYDDWYDRLDARFDLVEHSFGDARSLYFYDPDGNCVELGESDVARPGVGDIFEVVLEVEEIERAQSFYERLGFDVVDSGESRERVRLSTGPLDIELWEPQLGLADGRGGVHVDFGVAAPDPATAVNPVREDALAVVELPDGQRVCDPDGHYLSVVDRENV
jgi:catechol 2,3-dioxygenase-like lactoylglutathione lyase family enzyme